MRSKILQGLLLVIVLPFIGWSIFERTEATHAQYDEVMSMEGALPPIVEAAVAVAFDDRKLTQAEYAGIMKIARKHRPGSEHPRYGAASGR